MHSSRFFHPANLTQTASKIFNCFPNFVELAIKGFWLVLQCFLRIVSIRWRKAGGITSNGVSSFSLMVVQPFGVGVGGQYFFYLLGREKIRNGNFNGINLSPPQADKLLIIHFVGDVDFNEQQHLVICIGKNDIGPAHEILLTLHGHKLFLLALKVQATRRVFVHRALVVHVHSLQRASRSVATGP